MKTILRPLLLSIAVLASNFSHAADIPVVMDTPAGNNTSLSRLVTDTRGGLHLTWVHSEADVSTLYTSSLEAGAWSPAEQIAQGSDWFVNWADFPFMSVNDNAKVAHWLRKTSDGTYNYDVVASFYDNESNSWGNGQVIHKDGVSAEHGFVSMLPMSRDRTFITWLDGRNTIPSDHSDDHHSTRGAMTLRAGIFDAAGNTLNEWSLDEATCDCCQTSSALTDNGPIVVYRDRSEQEIRDIFITRWDNDAWTSPVAVHEDGWMIPGCPVNGPTVVARGQQVAVAWFSARDDNAKVKLALSQDGGASFAPPIMVAQGNTNGRVSMTLLASGELVVGWLATQDKDAQGKDAQLKASHFTAQGTLLQTIDIAATSASRRSGFPVIASAGNDVFMTWTQLNDTPRVRVAHLPLNTTAND